MVQSEPVRPTAIVVHAIPGRTRLRIPDKRQDLGFFRELAALLESDPRVKRVQVNPQTGSVLLEHESAIEAIAAALPVLLRLEPLRRVAVTAAPRPLSPVVVSSAAMLALVVLAGYQARRGRFLGSASENIWNAFSAWRSLKMPQVAAALLSGGLLQAARGHVLAPAVSFLFYALNLRKPPGAN